MLAIVVAGGAILALTVYRSEADRIHRDYDSRAFMIGQDVQGAIAAQGSSGEPIGDHPTHLQRHIDALVALDPAILRIDLYDVGAAAATVVASSDSNRVGTSDSDPVDLGDERAAVSADRIASHEDSVGDTPALHVTIPFLVAGQSPLMIAVHLSTAERDRALAALLRNFAIGFGSSVALTTLALVLGVRVLVLRRSGRMLAAFDRLESGDFNARVEHVPSGEPRDEMLRLAARFNNMAASIQELHAQVAEAATIDHLTGLYNRRFAMDALDREIARVRRQGEPLSVIMVDLDGLKQINDRHGHIAGDRAICHAAACLSGALRGGDYAARAGGDEFVAVLPNCDSEMLGAVIERLQSAARGAGVSAASSTVSAGGAVLRDADDADSLLHRADEAMYDAKRAGKDQSRIAA